MRAVQLRRVKGEHVLLGAVGRALDRAHLEGMRGARLAVAPLRRLGAQEIIAVQMFRHLSEGEQATTNTGTALQLQE